LTKEDVADIVNVGIEILVRHRYELPAFDNPGTGRDICAVTLARFSGEKGADISSQNIFFDDSLTRHLAILSADYRKNSSEPVFRQ